MLGYVEGNIIHKNNDTFQCIITAGGVGYEVFIHPNHFERVCEGAHAHLWLHTVVREDALLLYGFATELEKTFFRTLISVSGLGPKSALSLLGALGAEQIVTAILDKQEDTLSSVSGIGKKTAQKIILELKSKIEKLAWLSRLKSVSSPKKISTQESKSVELRSDLTSALTNLGYSIQQIKPVLEYFESNPSENELGFGDYLRLALKQLTKVTVSTHREMEQ